MIFSMLQYADWSGVWRVDKGKTTHHRRVNLLGFYGGFSMNTKSTITHTGIAIILVALAGSALAAEPQSDDATLLGGPQVVETSGPDSGDSMTGSAEQSRKAGDMPLRAYIGAVMSLRKDAKDNPELALTEEQQESIKAIGKAHAEKMRAFMEEHKEELGELRGPRGEAGERGERGERGLRGLRGKERGAQGDDRGERPSPEEMQRKREQLAELMSQAPSDAEAKKELWAILTPVQQTAVKERVSEMRTQREERVDRAMESGKDRKPKEGREGQRGKRGKKQQQEIDD
jgi:hypothetical protein